MTRSFFSVLRLSGVRLIGVHPFGAVASLALAVAMAGALATPAQAEEDIVEFGSHITVPQKDTVHDAVCFFCSVDVDGTVHGDIVVFFGSVHIRGHANHDVVNFFGDVTAADDSSIGHDMVNFFGAVRLGQNVTVGQDAVVMFGDLRAAPSVSFGHTRVVEPGWIFWGPFAAIGLAIYFVAHEARNYRRRRILGC